MKGGLFVPHPLKWNLIKASQRLMLRFTCGTQWRLSCFVPAQQAGKGIIYPELASQWVSHLKMFRVLHIAAGGRLKQREGTKKDSDTERWIALIVLEWLHKRDALSFSFCSNFLYQWVIHHTPPFPFSLSLSFELISHPPFWWRGLPLPLLFHVTHAPTHFPGAPAHSFTWFKYGNMYNTHFPEGLCIAAAHMNKHTHLNMLLFYLHPLNYLVLVYTWYKRDFLCNWVKWGYILLQTLKLLTAALLSINVTLQDTLSPTEADLVTWLTHSIALVHASCW